MKDRSGKLEFIGAVMDVTATRRAEQELQQTQAELARVARVTTLGELTASIAHEVNQPMAALATNARAALNFLGAQRPDLDEVRHCLGDIIKDAHRAGDILGRIRALVKKVPPRKDRLDMNEAILEIIALTRAK